MMPHCVKRNKPYIYIIRKHFKINAQSLKVTVTTTVIQLSLKMLRSLEHLNMTQIFIIPDHHHKSHPVKTFSVQKHMNHDIVRHPASEHSCVSGKACSDPGALQSHCLIKSYSCIVLLLSVALLIKTCVIWQASLHNTIV